MAVSTSCAGVGVAAASVGAFLLGKLSSSSAPPIQAGVEATLPAAPPGPLGPAGPQSETSLLSGVVWLLLQILIWEGLRFLVTMLWSSDQPASASALTSLASKTVEPTREALDGAALKEALNGTALKEAGSAETLRWLNTVVHNTWPFVDKAVSRILEQSVAPALAKKHVYLRHFSLGTDELEFGEISVRSMSTTNDQKFVELSLPISFASSCKNLDLSVGSVGLGVRIVVLKGDLVIRLGPLIGETPVAGGLTVFFLDPPTLELDFTGFATVADIPPLSHLVRSTIESVIGNQLVLPNVLAVPLGSEAQGVDRAKLKHPEPLGMLRATVQSAAGLRGADWSITGKSTSDPYVVLRLGSETWRSSTVSRTCSPVWEKGNVKDFLVFNETQVLTAEVYDQDFAGKDDFLGRVAPVPIADAAHSSPLVCPLTYSKEEPSAGDLTFEFDWFVTAPFSKEDLGDAAGDSGAASSSEAILLVVKVDGVFLPASLGREAAVKATLGSTERTTASATAPASAPAPADAATPSSPDATKESCPAQPSSAALLEIESTLYFPSTLDDLRSQVLALSLVNSKGKEIAVHPEAASVLSSALEAGTAPGPVQLQVASSKEVVDAQIAVSLLRLKRQAKPEPASS